MDREELRQLLINMGSELEIDDGVYEQYEPLRQRGLVEFYNGFVYKTDKGRKALVDPELIRM